MPKKGYRSLNPFSKPINLRLKRQKLKRRKVLKMLAVMDAQHSVGTNTGSNTAPPTPDCPAHTHEFLTSGRTGRRNALPDILGEHALVTSSDLPAKLQALSTSESVQGSSKQEHMEPSNSKS